MTDPTNPLDATDVIAETDPPHPAVAPVFDPDSDTDSDPDPDPDPDNTLDED
jgi:hypothetical protein